MSVYDKTPDVGGAWSSARRYRGLKTQNTRIPIDTPPTRCRGRIRSGSFTEAGLRQTWRRTTR